MFFSHRTLYTDGQASVPKLAEKLTLELVHHIEVAPPRGCISTVTSLTRASTLTALLLVPSPLTQKSLPRLEQQVEEKLEQTRAELEKYGNGPPADEAERLVYLMDVGGLA